MRKTQPKQTHHVNAHIGQYPFITSAQRTKVISQLEPIEGSESGFREKKRATAAQTKELPHCGSSGTCAANVLQARRRATGNCRKERPLASNRSERDFGLAHPPLPGMGRYEGKAPMSNHPMNKGLLAHNSQCSVVVFSSQMQLDVFRCRQMQLDRCRVVAKFCDP